MRIKSDIAIINEIVQKALLNKTSFYIEYQIETKKGQIKWLIEKGSGVYHKDGNLLFVDGSIFDNTDKKLIEEELKESEKELRIANLTKDRFFSIIAHDLRGPIGNLVGISNYLTKKHEKLKQEKIIFFINQLYNLSQKTFELLNSILTWSRVQSNGIDFTPENINIVELVNNSLGILSEEINRKEIKIKINMDNSTFAFANKESICTVIRNLLSNAIKFTDEGYIEFGYEKKGEYLEFFVKDTGIGIPKDRLDAIFERFIQADIEDKHALQGSGLGLSISKSYMEMLGGKIWVESEEGLGSTFYFTIPYNTISNDKNIIGNAVSEKDEEIGIRNLKILIAEDEEASFLFLSEALYEISHKITHAETGVEAIDACRNNPGLDLIFMDIRMPEMNGYEAARQIRLFNKDIIIIAQTAPLAVDKEMAIEAGCNDYIAKPINTTLLFDLIKKHVNK